MPRIPQSAHRVEEISDHEALVVDRELDGNTGQGVEAVRWRSLFLTSVPVVQIDQRVSVQAIEAEHDHQAEVGAQ